MGMSTYIQAFISDSDPAYQKHKKVLLVCLDSGVSLPEETAKYFGSKIPEKYLLEEKLNLDLKEGVHYEEYEDDTRDGIEIDLTKLPEGVVKLRFVNSY